MLVRELMKTKVVTAREDLPVSDLYDVLQGNNVHAVPVVDREGSLVGFVTQEDILFGSLGGSHGKPRVKTAGRAYSGELGENAGQQTDLLTGDIMTSPAISIGETADVCDLGKMLWKLRIHHVPVVADGKVCGIVSSMDYCQLIAERRFVEQKS